jgi:type IV pilus assembly protein PilZ
MAQQDPKKPNRQSERLHHELLVAYRAEGDTELKASAWAVNISKGGIFVNTPSPSPMGTIIRLTVSLPDVPAPTELTGRVMRVVPASKDGKEAPGMALEFIDVDAEKAKRIDAFVEKLRTAL